MIRVKRRQINKKQQIWPQRKQNLLIVISVITTLSRLAHARPLKSRYNHNQCKIRIHLKPDNVRIRTLVPILLIADPKYAARMDAYLPVKCMNESLWHSPTDLHMNV